MHIHDGVIIAAENTVSSLALSIEPASTPLNISSNTASESGPPRSKPSAKPITAPLRMIFAEEATIPASLCASRVIGRA